ncbi:hypothetical protein D3C71_1874540 [compost metagenome]
MIRTGGPGIGNDHIRVQQLRHIRAGPEIRVDERSIGDVPLFGVNLCDLNWQGNRGLDPRAQNIGIRRDADDLETVDPASQAFDVCKIAKRLAGMIGLGPRVDDGCAHFARKRPEGREFFRADND